MTRIRSFRWWRTRYGFGSGLLKKASTFPPRHLWIGTDPDEIPEEIWKGGVILKANHASGRNILLRKPPVNRETAKSRLRRFLRLRYGVRWHEAYYWRIPRKIVAEELIEDVRIEIKFYTCGGTVPWAWVAYDRPQRQHGAIWKTGADGKLYVTDELSLDFSGSANEPLPECAEEAATLAREIGKHFDLVRVDFLSNGKDLWFSELTLTGAGGHFDDEAKSVVDETNGGWDLRESWFMTAPQTGWRKWYQSVLRRRLDAA